MYCGACDRSVLGLVGLPPKLGMQMGCLSKVVISPLYRRTVWYIASIVGLPPKLGMQMGQIATRFSPGSV
jgi:hypothetical protein